MTPVKFLPVPMFICVVVQSCLYRVVPFVVLFRVVCIELFHLCRVVRTISGHQTRAEHSQRSTCTSVQRYRRMPMFICVVPFIQSCSICIELFHVCRVVCIELLHLCGVVRIELFVLYCSLFPQVTLTHLMPSSDYSKGLYYLVLEAQLAILKPPECIV